MKKNFFKTLVNKYVNGTISDSHRGILESYFSDTQSRKNDAIPDEIIRERIFEGINRKISFVDRQKTRNKIYYGIAAAITIMILCTLLIFKLTVSPADSKDYLTFTTKNGQKKKSFCRMDH
ncbi:hypothetical protein [Pedobacter sp. P26]|uniref:hypothetical protein n=1 Tax=Pedobacter sp. P26 TaxID=3423956 RepID=UPI003D66CF67